MSVAPKPRGRPRQFDVGEALDQAVQVFWERGYQGASLDDLTQSMGLNRPSLYAAFGDKRALFLAAIDRYLATFGRAPIDAMAGEPEVMARVCAFLREAVKQSFAGSVAKGCMIACVATDSATCDMEIQAHTRAAIEATESALVAEFTHDLGASKAQALAGLLISFMQGIAIRARAGMTRDEVEDFADTALRLCRLLADE